MPSMKVSLPGMFANIKDALLNGDSSRADYYVFGLVELEQHLRDVIAGKHTIAEFAEHYCLTPGAKT